jgi:hypothetical protein
MLVGLGVPCGEGHSDGRIVDCMSGESICKQLVDELVPVGRAGAGNLWDCAIGLPGSIAIAEC